MAVWSETRTIHTITIDLPDEVVAKIEQGDEVEVFFNAREVGHDRPMPRPMRLSYTWTRYLTSSHPLRRKSI